MDVNEQNKQSQGDDQPKIFSVYIDENNHLKLTRRKFIRSAVILGTTVSLSGCVLLDELGGSMSEEEMVAALDQTLQAREVQNNSEPAPTNTVQTTPTDTSTPEPTSTITLTPTSTEEPHPHGKVTNSHNIFKGPHVDHPVASKTVVGEDVEILGRTDDGVWFKITDTEGTTGWVFSEFIEVADEVDIEVLLDIPTPVPTICECDVYTPCSCDNYTEPKPCSCDKHSCSCDAVHYWYPD